VEEVNGASEIQALFRPLHDVPKSRGAENERNFFFVKSITLVGRKLLTKQKN
jgi:hypothetical protein